MIDSMQHSVQQTSLRDAIRRYFDNHRTCSLTCKKGPSLHEASGCYMGGM